MANSFSTLNLTGTGALTANAANSLGTATVNMGDGTNAATIILNIDGALADSANAIRFNPGILTLSNGAGVTTALSLPTRLIELNGAGGATINNANTNAARTLTLGGGISSAAAGAKTLTLGGANTGDNTISGDIIDGTAGSIALTKADAGKWVLGGTNTYTGATTIAGGTLRLSNTLAVQNSSGVTLSGAAAGTLQLGTDTAFSAFPAITGPSAQQGTIVSDRATLGAAVTHALGTANFGNNTFNITQGFLVNSGTAGISFTSITMGGGSGGSTTLNPTTANLTIVGNATSANTGTHTLILGGTSTGNSIGGVIDEGAQRTTQTVTVNGTGAWLLSGNNTYSGLTTVAGSATLTLSGDNSGAAGGVTLSTAGTGATTPRLNVNSATALGTGTLNFGGGLATDSVRIDNTSAGLVTVSTANAITLNRNFTFIGTQDLNLGTGTTTLGTAAGNRTFSITDKTLTFGGAIAQSIAGTGITKSGAGTLVLSGAGSSYTGTTAVNTGTLIAGANAPSGSVGAFGNASSEISVGVAGGSTDASLLIGGAFTVGRNIRTATSDITDNGTRVLTLGGNTAHNSEFSGNIFLGTASQAGRGVTLTAANGGQVTFSGVIQEPGSMDPTTYTVTKAGLGTVVLSNANTYTGSTLISAGTLRFAKMASLYNGTSGSWTAANINVKSGATFAVNVDSAGTDGFDATSLNTLLGNISVANTATEGLQVGAILGFDTSTASGGTFTQGDAIANSTGANGGIIGLTKLGTGTLVLDKTNTYTGTTTVSAGTLLVNGSISGSTTTVNGGTLGGSGGTTGAVTVATGGTIAPGSSIGTLNTGTLAFTGGAFGLEINTTAITSDLANVAGNLNLGGGATLSITDFSVSGTPLSIGQVFTFIDYSGTWDSGTFAGHDDDSQFTLGLNQYRISYNGVDNATTAVTLQVVPEPGSAVLLLGGVVALAGFRRRRA